MDGRTAERMAEQPRSKRVPGLMNRNPVIVIFRTTERGEQLKVLIGLVFAIIRNRDLIIHRQKLRRPPRPS
jgi:hypothetical protein